MLIICRLFSTISKNLMCYTFHNLICLTGQLEDVLSSNLSLTERMIIMSTYEELQIILTTALLIVAILTYTHKK